MVSDKTIFQGFQNSINSIIYKQNPLDFFSFTIYQNYRYFRFNYQYKNAYNTSSCISDTDQISQLVWHDWNVGVVTGRRVSSSTRSLTGNLLIPPSRDHGRMLAPSQGLDLLLLSPFEFFHKFINLLNKEKGHGFET